MFNKPGIFGRNDPVTRRDVAPVLGSAPRSSGPNSDMSVNKNSTARKETVVNPLPASPVSSGPMQAVPSTNASSAVGVSKESLVNNSVTEARLIVGPEVKLKGAEILDCDTLVVEGRVEATMDSRVIRVAENGSFAGKVSIDIAEVHGTFEGELTARSQLIIHSTGRVSGTIRYGKLVADEGGELCGDISVIPECAASRPKAVVEPLVALGNLVG